jgi:CBS domain-containing protein
MMIESIASILKKQGHGVYSVAQDDPVHEAISMMAANGIAAVLVLDGKRLAGIVSAKDYGNRVVLQGRTARETRVREIMTSPVVTVAPEATVLECLAIMAHHKIRHLPVFRDSELLGVVSMGELVNAVIADQAFKIDQLMAYVGHK